MDRDLLWISDGGRNPLCFCFPASHSVTLQELSHTVAFCPSLFWGIVCDLDPVTLSLAATPPSEGKVCCSGFGESLLEGNGSPLFLTGVVRS